MSGAMTALAAQNRDDIHLAAMVSPLAAGTRSFTFLSTRISLGDRWMLYIQSL